MTLKYDKLLSRFAFNFNLRRYTVGRYVYVQLLGDGRMLNFMAMTVNFVEQIPTAGYILVQPFIFLS